MRYTTVFTVTFDADDDATARSVAHQHHQELLDALRIEGADHPHTFTLDRVIAADPSGERDVASADKEII